MKDKVHDAFLAALRGLEGTQLPLEKGELETPATSGTDEDNMAEDKPSQGWPERMKKPIVAQTGGDVPKEWPNC